jgi:hypothetical protein
MEEDSRDIESENDGNDRFWTMNLLFTTQTITQLSSVARTK